MKKSQLIAITLIGLAVACNAMSLTEKIILSKSTETTPVTLVSENPDETLTITGITYVTNNHRVECSQVKGAERLAIKALKNIGRFLVKELCRITKPDFSNRQNISYARRNFYNTRIMAGPNLTAAVQ